MAKKYKLRPAAKAILALLGALGIGVSSFAIWRMTRGNDFVVAADGFTGYYAARTQLLKDMVEEQGYNFKYISVESQEERARMLEEGKIDVALVPLATLMQEYEGDESLYTVYVSDVTSGADSAVVNLDKLAQLATENGLDANLYLADGGLGATALIKDLSLQSKITVSMTCGSNKQPEASPSRTLAMALAQLTDEMKPSSYTTDCVESSTVAFEKLSSEEEPDVAAAFVWEPETLLSRKAGNLEVILTSARTEDVIIDTATASANAYKNKKDGIQAVVDGLAFLNDKWTSQGGRSDIEALISADVASQIGGLSQSDSEQLVCGIRFFTSVQSHDWLSGAGPVNFNERKAFLADMIQLYDPSAAVNSAIEADPSFVLDAMSGYSDTVKASLAEGYDCQAERTEAVRKSIEANPQQAEAIIKNALPVGTVFGYETSENLGFPTGQTDLTAEAKVMIAEIASELKSQSSPDLWVRVEGRASDIGDKNLNDRLASQRAINAANELERLLGPDWTVVPINKGVSQFRSDIPATDERNQSVLFKLVEPQ